MPHSWSIVDLADWASAETEEPLGTKDKFWVMDPGGQKWLFKFARVRAGVVRGEDWSEWVVHHLAGLLGVPTVEICPAVSGDKRGVVSKSVVPDGHALIHGNELLSQIDSSYDRTERRENAGYTPGAVHASLSGAQPPLDRQDLDQFTAFDVWAGYTVLDAWVAGRDRHHENWAVISKGRQRWLYPSFDHGNALGFQESDEKRQRCVNDARQLLTWARKGKSHHFAGRPTLVAVAHEALTLATPSAKAYWLDRLGAVDSTSVRDILDAVPDAILSDSGRMFCLRLLEANRGRVLDGD